LGLLLIASTFMVYSPFLKIAQHESGSFHGKL